MRKNILKQELMIGVISILIALALALWLERKLTRPIEEIAEKVHEIADGNFEDQQEHISSSSTPELKQLMEDINTMANKIMQSKIELRKVERVAAWREIARGLAHEVKNPLTPILGAMSVIRRAFELEREDFPEILLEQSGAVIEEVKRLKELSDAFANFARLPTPQVIELDVLPLLQSVLNLYVDENCEVNIEIGDVFKKPEVIIVHADKNQLRTVFNNLIKNALEAMEGLEIESHKILINLKSVFDKKQRFLEIGIQDNGVGLSKDVSNQLFTPYFTTKGSRGTGLGLALCHRIISEHGGSIWAEDKDEKLLSGALFIIRLPLDLNSR